MSGTMTHVRNADVRNKKGMAVVMLLGVVMQWGCHSPDTEILDAGAFARRGLKHAQADELQPAIADFSQAITLDPHNAGVIEARGVVYARNHDLDHAIADFTKVIALNPRRASAYYNRGIAYDDLGKIQLALADYNKTVQLNPRDAGACFNRALALDRAGRPPAEVVSAYRQFLKLATPDLADSAHQARQRIQDIEKATALQQVFQAPSLREKLLRGATSSR